MFLGDMINRGLYCTVRKKLEAASNPTNVGSSVSCIICIGSIEQHDGFGRGHVVVVVVCRRGMNEPRRRVKPSTQYT